MPTPRGRAAVAQHGRRRGGSRARSRRRPLTVTLTALALPVAGIAVDGLTGSAPGPAFVVAAVVAAILGAVTCSRAGAWWVAYAPPLVVAPITAVAEGLTGGAVGGHGKGLATSAVHWSVDAFPAMAAAEAALLAVLAARWIRSRRSTRRNGA
ncbi:hypothetical protein EKH77_00775 [Streptomyces luteoverticillatus]|uniref:DUF6542 domain-containing protein n=1 Tax=Streptomyces luteoverticillatus TaxID=66425 RepID=A0A3S9PC48_STRLT|nr:DUF6542 domain-containing protein [Streptomyces luteoverticillatus]AZQ69943.1 hypothetical protein EKH77_00775 [Streptomyces luteoverticillatus]